VLCGAEGRVRLCVPFFVTGALKAIPEILTAWSRALGKDGKGHMREVGLVSRRHSHYVCWYGICEEAPAEGERREEDGSRNG